MPRTVIAWLALAVLMAGCGDMPRPERQAPSSPPAPARSAPTPAPPLVSTSRDGKDGKDAWPADDVNGDGRSDLVVEFGEVDRPYLAVVHGSPRGLDPGKRAVVSSDTFAPWLPGTEAGSRADLDGDGFGDVLGHGCPPGRDGPRPYIFWGGPRGIKARTLPTPVRVPEESELSDFQAVAGDFNGDGAADVAMSSPDSSGEDTNLAVLYGPFSRRGIPNRQTLQPSPTGDAIGRLAVDEIDGRRATGLIVYEPDDDDQTSGWLLGAGPAGPAKEGRKLNAGMAAAFGDFDGDGTRDVAIGDDGHRNDEPGYETEPPSVDRTLTVYYGDGRQKVFKGTAGRAVSGDFNGDGRDDLAFGGEIGLLDLAPSHTVTRIFWGGPGGLRAGGRVAGVDRAAPLTAADYDADGDDDLVFASGYTDLKLMVTDGSRVLARFATSILRS
ncbi:hypothetical protein [Nonomuraea sp. B19D2]|uniref:FG-GAP repeat domain-containing protein n=1 Tax=Nonomuraea sp. B19D2 TaxID=3159561 RepID=UPI0032DB65CC